MHFNTKYINQGDSEKDIKDKVNHNFNQIISFATGQEGIKGPKGPTGIPGPSGKIGKTGSTGDRASDWFRSTTLPLTGSSQEFDLWVDDSSSLGDIYERGNSSWTYTGLSLFNSDYFEVYSSIIGPLGIDSKSAIGFNSSNYIPDQTSLVISDTYFSSVDVNPNNSKLLISTEDQITNPIFSFIKSNSSSLYYPSFYWKNTGILSDLIFSSPGKFSISSLLDLEISSYDSGLGGISVYLSSFQGTTPGDLIFKSMGDIKLFTNNSNIGNINISSLNFGVDPTKLYTKTLTEISYNSGGIYNYILSSTPVSGSPFNYFGGISVNSNSTSEKVFNFTGILGHSLLYGLPLGSVSSGNHKQVVFGETGGVTAGSTGGPYSYHVKRLNNISVTPSTVYLIPYTKRNNTTITLLDLVSVSSVLNLTDSNQWNSNMIVATVNSSLSDDAYIFVPSSSTSLEPLFYSGEGNEYRVYLNDMQGSKQIKGIAYPYYYESSTGLISTRYVYQNFPSPCSYLDLFWAYQGSSTNPNGRIFWKTCSGSGGILEVTNQYTISGNSAPTFPSSS